MNVHEYQAKQIFRAYAIPVPQGVAIFKPEDAAEAARIGLITAVGEAQPVVDALLAKSPAVLRTAKAALRAGNLADAEAVYLHKLLPLDDCEEGVRAFLEKRPPNWQ